MLKQALAYAELGLKVFPCGYKSKRPATVNGFKDATVDRERIIEWWTKNPNYNIGIAIPEDVLVLDVDLVDGEGAIDLGKLPPTVTCRTPRATGGYHFWYRIPAGTHVRPSTGIVKGVDVRAFGSYVMAPPSIHPDTGEAYYWERSLLDSYIEDCPDWIVPLVHTVEEETASRIDPVKIISGVQEGGRQTALFKLAARLRRLDLSKEEALIVLKTAAMNASPPYVERPMEELVDRVWKRYPAEPKVQHKKKIWKLKDLMSANIPEPTWYVQDILPQGFTLLYADAKLGKSMLCANMARAVSEGDYAFNQFRTKKSGVLYLDLEQGEHFARLRWNRILQGRQPDDNLDVTFEWDRMDQGGFKDLEDYIEVNPHTGLIVIDILARFWPAGEVPGKDAYQKDVYVLAKLSALAKHHNIAIVGVHHRSKQDGRDFLAHASGSMGMTAASDVIWSLSRDRDSTSGVVRITGKNVKDRLLMFNVREDGFIWETRQSSQTTISDE